VGDAPSYGQAEAALVAEAAREAVVAATGHRGARVARVDVEDDVAMAYVLMLDGQYAAVSVRREFGRWRVVQIQEVSA
jgi:plasmid replication initiation protein